jgi:hypothetical protein
MPGTYEEAQRRFLAEALAARISKHVSLDAAVEFLRDERARYSHECYIGEVYPLEGKLR